MWQVIENTLTSRQKESEMASVITESDVRESMFFIGELVVDERNGLVAKVAADPDENGLILIEYCNPLFDMEDDMVQAREISRS
ncbi:MAG: hypothetical protein A2528_00235 [Candidatus Staskawiczbacteria bacterium RIFOXYD2_FULL_37_9]|uniref:Uncharacterized protein n=1 Tax=Candidatus Staskawiczbacteria bacterium RIFOXYB1_FULL_37_44 TaxID=1802223 RepID=A0A1G2IVN3_9BACT|nr:MAG: hypothetical protein A2358_02935 [Candidatus Staskawiczbacteria bacterium RIFOXYB1_FULL_37_44]OGZ83880.1 MAG: hypothetical protein A2416_02650 [Candidatus Staskawiczbacteria bacterium RIFOXYC1_FULL_37_52]OGZ87350.1 MAG: hypothetical protein A2444_03350 [Candidatus Staskawiczbacteria bacterium RIFOXYC2_FULL_37_19]OGZ89387.1 MAG: hypothetical protein A2581_00710 [Candidatus Staskawiczbacteria bacterium RIFOXYD1_FULL_37_110]OGZ94142.1 MAG: hypothetical protein A2528_00235 [Candidatus Stask